MLALLLGSATPANAEPEPTPPASVQKSDANFPGMAAPGDRSGPWVVLIAEGYPYPCWTISGGSASNNANLIEGNCNVNPDAHHQEWTFYNIQGGFYQLTNYHSGKCLYPKNNSTVDGTAIAQTTCGGVSNYWQQWAMRRVYDPPEGQDYYVIQNLQTGKCMNHQSTQGVGVIVILRPCGDLDQHYNEMFTWYAGDR